MFSFARVLSLLALAAGLTACTTRPFEVPPDRDAYKLLERAAEAKARARPRGERPKPVGPHDYDDSPRPIALCYSSQLNTPEEVRDRVRELCPNDGQVVYFNEDAFLNQCSIFQPNRVTFICTPGPQPPSPYY
ncbi:MAG: hypothetical protein MI920_21500 [Kiloniellales bacterium]|nr:hypothetical protein [Kiloniellales bacterium]